MIPSSAPTDASKLFSAESATSAQRLRVLYIDHTAVLSGGELAMLALLRHTDPALVESAVVLGAEGPLAEELRTLVPTLVLPMPARLLDTRKGSLSAGNAGMLTRVALAVPYIWRLSRLIRAARPDVVHTNSLKADLLGGIAARLARVPLVWHVRDRIAPDYLPGAAVSVFRLLCRWIPNSIVGCSQSVLDTLKLPESMPRAVAYSGVDPADFPARQETLEGAATDALKAPVLGFVGRLAPWKGQHVFLKAAAALRSEFPGARYVLLGSVMFGEQSYEQELRALVREHGMEDAVEFRGFVRKVEQEIRKFDVLVHASTSPEPFGQTIVQGMAAGLPVVAAQGGGASEIIRDGIDGLLVERGNDVALAAALRRVLGDPVFARQLASNGRLRVDELFTIQQTADTLLHVFRRIARRPSGPARVLFYNATARVSGGEVVLRNILEELPRETFEPTVVCPDGPLAEQVQALGVPTIAIPELTLRFTRDPLKLVKYARSLLCTALTLRSAVRQTRPHIVHANSIRAGLVSLFATAGFAIPLQWHVHDTLPPRVFSLLTRLAALVSRRSRFIAVSESTAINLAGGRLTRGLRGRTSVLLNAVRREAVVPREEAAERLRAELGLSPDTFCVLHVGQIARRKNQLGAVRAFYEAFGAGSQAHLLLAGSPMFEGGRKYLDEVERAISQLGLQSQVHVLGYRADARELMAGCDVVLLNSLGDPCPLTILEAMAAGAAILASRVDGIPELISAGRTGWLVDPLTEAEFAKGLREIAGMPAEQRQAVGAAARAASTQRTLPAYVAQWAEITRHNINAAATGVTPVPQPQSLVTNGANEYAGH